MWGKTGRQAAGQAGERLARTFLTRQGYMVEAANVRFPVGEIDLIAHDGPTLCFIEVRSASSDDWGGPFASVTAVKQQRLIRAARWYLARLRAVPEAVRFDVVGIRWRPAGAPEVSLIQGAFTVD